MFERTETELLEAMDDGVAAMAAASARLLRAVAEFDDRELWETDGATSMTAWLAARYSLTWRTATEWVRVARALRVLPAIANAYREAQLSWDQLRPLTKFATAETDERWAREAPSYTSAGLWLEAKRHERLRAKEVVEARRRRYCSMRWNEDKTELYVEARLPEEEGASFERAVNRRAEQVVITDDPVDPGEARTADALVELVTGKEMAKHRLPRWWCTPCHAHHRLVHEGGWSIRRDPVRRLRFHDPTGRALQSFGKSEATLRAS